MDNLPTAWLGELVGHCEEQGLSNVALSIDWRSMATSLESNLEQQVDLVMNTLRSWQAVGHKVQPIFLESSDESLIARYAESRRKHPVNHTRPNFTLKECIDFERQTLQRLREVSHHIDTSFLAPKKLRGWIKDLLSVKSDQLVITLESFGFKYSVPKNVDLLFDARCLPNPYYDEKLRHQTGLDEPVQAFMQATPLVESFIQHTLSYLNTWLPYYEQDGRSYLTIAIGCTGGQHRSVYCIEQLAKHLANMTPLVRHHCIHISSK
jgi:UPF0042 nucleotide-binding protein